jgi:amino acid transporter
MHCACACRILFCYSRDRAVPFSNLWLKVEPRTKSPIFAVWGVALAAFCLGLPMLGSYTAFNAILSLSTISLVIVYGEWGLLSCRRQGCVAQQAAVRQL